MSALLFLFMTLLFESNKASSFQNENDHWTSVALNHLSAATTKIERMKFITSFKAASHFSTALHDIIIPIIKMTRYHGTITPEYLRVVNTYEAFHQRIETLSNNYVDSNIHLDWTQLPFNFVSFRFAINGANDMFKHYLLASPFDKSTMQHMFLQSYNTTYEHTLTSLFKALADTSSKDEDNLMTSTRILFYNNKRLVATCLLYYLRLLAQSMPMQIAYDVLTFSSSVDQQLSLWKKRVWEIKEHAYVLDRKMRDEWNQQYRSDVDIFYLRNKQLSKFPLAAQLYNYLADRYSYRIWFVIVYTGEKGVDKRHYFDNCGAYYLYDKEKHRVVIVTSVDRFNSGPKINNLLYFQNVKLSKNGYYFPFEEIAKKINENIGYSCNANYVFQGVIEYKAHPVTLTGDPKFVAKRKVLIRRLFAKDKYFLLLAVINPGET